MAYHVYLPLITNLTPEQRAVLDDENAVAISGGAGTGKSIVALWKHIRNISIYSKSSIIMTYTKTLQLYLYYTVKDNDKNAAKSVHSTCGWLVPKNSYSADEIIVDEAQDLKISSLNRIKEHATQVSYGADFNQQLYKNKVTESEIKSLFPNNIEHSLQENYRNTYHILNFTRHVLPNIFINKNTINSLKESNLGNLVKIFLTNNNELDIIINLINEFYSETHNIAVLLPYGGNKCEFHGKNNNVLNYYEAIKSKFNGKLSMYYNNSGADLLSIENLHITTIKSSKGLEFDTVIIPQFDILLKDVYNNDVGIISENDCYVALTRSKTNLYILTSDEQAIKHIDKSVYKLETNQDNMSASSNEEWDEIPF